MSHKCDKCGRKDAVFYRFLSGEKLCFSCLMDRVYRIVKRNMSLSGVLKPQSRIAVAIAPPSLLEGLVCLRIVKSVERKYRGSIVALIADHPSAECVLNLPGRDLEGIDVFRVIVEPRVNIGGLGMIEAHRFMRGVMLHAARDSGADVLMIPACFEKLVVMSIASFLEGSIEGIGECVLVPVTQDHDISVVNVMRGVSCQELAFISLRLYGEGVFDLNVEKPKLTPEENVAFKILESCLEEGSTETLYSIGKTWEKLRGRNLTRTCEWCGEPSENAYCRWCGKILGNSKPRVSLVPVK